VRLDDPPSLRSCLSRIVHVTEQSPVNGSDEPITLTHGPAVGGLRTRTFLRASSVGVSALWMQLKGSGAASPQPSSTTTATVLPLGSRGCAASSHGFPSSAGGLVAMRSAGPPQELKGETSGVVLGSSGVCLLCSLGFGGGRDPASLHCTGTGRLSARIEVAGSPGGVQV
jgi:hypothetical protein